MKKSITETIKEHPRVVFFVRFFFWVLFALVLPILFIGFRFQLFSKQTEIVLSGWGIIAVVILLAFVIGLLRYIRLGLKKKHNLFLQCLNGFLKIIVPLIGMFVILYNMKNNLDYFLQALGCLIICEVIAIPINPMPAWVYESQKDLRVEERKDTIDYLLSKISIGSKDNKDGN